jgi:radical SAM superfamily enzyme YgiQ (UPF0313 family)
MREAAFEMIALGKKNNCTVIVTSSDSTDHYEKYLEAGADYIIQGEGELALQELISTLNKNESPALIKGLVFTTETGIVKQPKRAVLRDLDKLPLPAWDLVDV